MKNKMTRSIKYSTAIIFLQCAAPEQQQQQFLWAGMWDDFHRLCAPIQQMQSWIFQISLKYINFVCSRYHHHIGMKEARVPFQWYHYLLLLFSLHCSLLSCCPSSQRSNILTSKRTTIRFPIAVRSCKRGGHLNFGRQILFWYDSLLALLVTIAETGLSLLKSLILLHPFFRGHHVEIFDLQKLKI